MSEGLMDFPKQLQNLDFRFCLIPKGEKGPFENGWNTENCYSYYEGRLTKHIERYYNYGVVCGYGDLVVIDYDNLEYAAKLMPALPKTFTVKTGSGKFHAYYVSPNAENFKILDESGKTIIDFQAAKKNCAVAPGSIHPSGNKYEILEDLPIATLPFSELKAIFISVFPKERLPEKWNKAKPARQYKGTGNKVTDDIKKAVSFSQVFEALGGDASKDPTMCILGHESNGGKCFSITDSEGLGHCFHCDWGGDVIKLVTDVKKLKFRDALKWIVDTFKLGLNLDLKTQVLTLLVMDKRPEATERIAEDIEENEAIRTIRNDINDEMYIYRDGVYLPQAKTYIQERCRELLGEAYTQAIANQVIAKIQADTFIDQDTFFNSENPDFVAVQNGILNLRSRELLPFSPEQVFFNKLPVKYVPGADCPKIKEFFASTLKDKSDIDVIQEQFGYALYKDYTFEKALMLLGSGRNGKGKTLALIKRFIGVENCAEVPLERIENDNFALSGLFKKMANLCGDLSKTALKNTGNFKKITGRDLIEAPRKFLSPVKFTNYAKMIFSCNELPTTYDMTLAFFNRWIIIEFNFTFLDEVEYYRLSEEERQNVKIGDPEIINKITTPEEMSGLLNWALDGLHRLWKNKRFSYNASTKETQEKWLRKSNSLEAFIIDCCTFDFDKFTPKGEFRTAYNEYCSKYKLLPLSDRFMGELLATKGVTEDKPYLDVDGKNKQVRVWQGIISHKTGKTEKTNILPYIEIPKNHIGIKNPSFPSLLSYHDEKPKIEDWLPDPKSPEDVIKCIEYNPTHNKKLIDETFNCKVIKALLEAGEINELPAGTYRKTEGCMA